MIEPFWGEFLISPIPLEMSLNRCSHNCTYCFANLNQPKRTGDVKGIMRLLSDYQNRDTITARLLQAGYPVCVSNRTDPFSVSNYRQMLPILETMAALGIPVSFQTKGGPGHEEALQMFPGALWYISISMLDEQVRRRVEPGAPTIESRFELIEKVRSSGGRVILGLNPCVPEWLDDPLPLLERAQKAGAEAVWIEELHLSASQIQNMSKAEYASLGDELIARARLKLRAGADTEAFFEARLAAHELGLEVFSNGQPTPSRIWDIYREVYPMTFPTNQDFVNYCHEQDLDGTMIPFEIWADIMRPSLPEGRFRMNKYLGASSRSIFETHKIPSQLTFDELLSAVWSIRRAKQSPVRMPNYSYAALKGQNGWIQLVDENQRPYLLFDAAGGFTQYYTQVLVEWSEAEA